LTTIDKAFIGCFTIFEIAISKALEAGGELLNGIHKPCPQRINSTNSAIITKQADTGKQQFMF
jgi:hypothetical protein